MDWNKINSNITDTNSELIEITRDNINDLVIGSYIKYIKDDKLIGGGFLIKVNNPSKIVYTELILKSNIIWKLRFIKYKVYMKKINQIKDTLYNQYSVEIEHRKKELDEEINSKIKLINLNKNKYKIHINN
jgi:hypothetical protein